MLKKYEVVERKEKRLSTKILAHKVKRYLPGFAYHFLLKLRFAFFRSDCSRYNLQKVTYTDGAWVNRKTTKDLRKIQEYLTKKEGKMSVFQVGIGNSSLFECFLDNKNVDLFGITISDEELAYAREKFSSEIDIRYNIRYMNKYSDELKLIQQRFDYIVDNDLSSYSCCKKHFFLMLDNYKRLLNKEGEVLVGFEGISYFDSGFGLSELSLKRIALEKGFTFYKGNYSYILKKK